MTGSLTQRIMFACGVRNGLTQPEVCEATGGKRTTVGAMLGMLVADGRLHKGGVRGHLRYFAKATDRDTHAAEHAEQIAAILAHRASSPQEKSRRKHRRQAERRKAERAAAGHAPRPPKMSDEERRRRKAEYAKRYYAAKIGEKVKPKLTPADCISTTPRKAQPGEAGRGRGIVIGASKGGKQQRASAEPIIPPNVKITICPSGRDTRFYVDPSIAGRGAVTAAWLEERQKQREQTP